MSKREKEFEEKKETYTNKINNYQNSGMSLKKWCEKTGNKPTAMNIWINKLNMRNSAKEGQKGYTPKEPTVAFLKMALAPEEEPNKNSVNVRKSDRIIVSTEIFKIEIPKDFSEEALVAVLKAVRAAC